MLGVFLRQTPFEVFLTMVNEYIVFNIIFKSGHIILVQYTLLYTIFLKIRFFYCNTNFTYIFLIFYNEIVFVPFLIFRTLCPIILYYFCSFNLLLLLVNNA